LAVSGREMLHVDLYTRMLVLPSKKLHTTSALFLLRLWAQITSAVRVICVLLLQLLSMPLSSLTL